MVERASLSVSLSIVMIAPVAAHAQTNDLSRSMNRPVPPFHIIGNIYYVGASDITSYLIVTPSGNIILDGGFVETAPEIEDNIKTLGFKMSDVKILLSSHEHLDHAGGLAELKRLTGAQFVALAEEVPGLEKGDSFPAVTPDRVIHDGDTVSLGGVTMTAHLTPGHTPGCTTWTMATRDGGKSYNVVFVGSASVLPTYKLIDRPGPAGNLPRHRGRLRENVSRFEIASLRCLSGGARIVLLSRTKTPSPIEEPRAKPIHRSSRISEICCGRRGSL